MDKGGSEWWDFRWFDAEWGELLAEQEGCETRTATLTFKAKGGPGEARFTTATIQELKFKGESKDGVPLL